MNATVVNNIVRSTDTSSNVDVGFVLEAHYFLKAWPLVGDSSVYNGLLNRQMAPPGLCVDNSGTPIPTCTEVALGPFVAIEVGGGSSATPAATGPITGYALGAMVGFHQPSPKGQTPNTRSWNFGVGLRIDPKAQLLGDGLTVNAPLPTGDSIRYKTEPRPGIMLLSSFSF